MIIFRIISGDPDGRRRDAQPTDPGSTPSGAAQPNAVTRWKWQRPKRGVAHRCQFATKHQKPMSLNHDKNHAKKNKEGRQHDIKDHETWQALYVFVSTISISKPTSSSTCWESRGNLLDRYLSGRLPKTRLASVPWTNHFSLHDTDDFTWGFEWINNWDIYYVSISHDFQSFLLVSCVSFDGSQNWSIFIISKHLRQSQQSGPGQDVHGRSSEKHLNVQVSSREHLHGFYFPLPRWYTNRWICCGRTWSRRTCQKTRGPRIRRKPWLSRCPGLPGKCKKKGTKWRWRSV